MAVIVLVVVAVIASVTVIARVIVGPVLVAIVPVIAVIAMAAARAALPAARLRDSSEAVFLVAQAMEYLFAAATNQSSPWRCWERL